MRMPLVLAGFLAVPLLMAADETTPPPGWQDYSPKDRSFSVWLPEKSGRRSERERTVPVRGLSIKINLVQVEVRGKLTYEAASLLLPTPLARRFSQKEKLEFIRDVFLSEVRGKVYDETEVKQGQAAGKEYVIQVGRSLARLRVFAQGRRLYRASVLGSKTHLASKDADTFLESYQPSSKTPEKQADKRKGKADASGK
jgi:hypothetical protein